MFRQRKNKKYSYFNVLSMFYLVILLKLLFSYFSNPIKTYPTSLKITVGSYFKKKIYFITASPLSDKFCDAGEESAADQKASITTIAMA